MSHLAYDEIEPQATDGMKQKNTYQPFKGIGQTQTWAMKCKHRTFEELMYEIGNERVKWLKEQKENYGGFNGEL